MAAILSITGAAINCAAETSTDPIIVPDGTYLYAEKDSTDLFLDVYNPAEDSETVIDGRDKPTILFMFGGGFMSGARDKDKYLPWFKLMTDAGYRIISIDYRLGMKGTNKVGIAQVNILDKAIHMAVEDLFNATEYILDNSETLGVNPKNIVTCGTSAGAITVMQAEYELCNRTSYAQILPANFNYAGVMSFSGAILSRHGKLTWSKIPAPTLMFHGTVDNIVTYKQIKFFRTGFFGTDKIVERFKKFGYIHHVYRYIDHSHEIATIMDKTTRYQFDFLENIVMKGNSQIIDAYIDDPTIPLWQGDLDDMFGQQESEN